MADRVIVMSPRPGRVVGELRVNLPRPRFEHLREREFFDTVDRLLGMLTSSEERDTPNPRQKQPVPPSPSGDMWGLESRQQTITGPPSSHHPSHPGSMRL
jgi:hypothetical protein